MIRVHLGLLLIASAVIGCGERAPRAAEVISFTGPTMGTKYTVRLVKPQSGLAPDWQSVIDRRLVVVNQRMSTYDPESELSRFNASESTDWFEVSDETAAVVDYALSLAEDSGGAFDPTVGPLVNLWGFGPDDSVYEPPSTEAIAAAREHVGYQKVEVRLDPPALRKSDPAVYLDLSAVAKGHGVDAVADVLETEGASAYLVEIGGEVKTLGHKPDGEPWRVGVETPDAVGDQTRRVLELSGEAVATSGDYRNFFMHEGRRYSHTIDPSTGWAVDHALATVSVLADSCREADALATALLVMGPERGYDWATERGVAALLVSRDADDSVSEQATDGWFASVPRTSQEHAR